MTGTNKNTSPASSITSSQVKDLIRVLNIVIARIEIALIDGSKDIATLTANFVDIVNNVKAINVSTKNAEDTVEKGTIEVHYQQISQDMKSAMVAFQFYDRLNQRMAQASKILLLLTEVFNGEKKSLETETWRELENLIRSSYTLDSDLPLLDDILTGISIEEALKNATARPDDDDVEFF